MHLKFNPWTYTQIQTPAVVQKGMEPLPPRILFCCSMSKRFHLQWKAFDLLNKMRYILWVVVLLRACDVTNNDCHLGHHLGFYQELQVRLKPREMVIFCAWHETWHINKRFSLFYPQDLLLSLKKIRKKALLVLSLKMAWPPPTYDVISRNPRNWPLLNLTQNAPEGWTNSYWKRQVPMFYPLRENSAKP